MVMDYAINGDLSTYLKFNSKIIRPLILFFRDINRKISSVLHGIAYQHSHILEGEKHHSS